MAATDLQGLLDEAAIRDIVSRYAHTVDARDIDGILACFTSDGRFDGDGGRTTAVGHAEIRRFYEGAFTTPRLAQPASSTHLMANTVIELDGDRARSETQAIAHLASAAEGLVTRGVRYSDDFVRTDAGWRIAHRRHRSLWETTAPGDVHHPAGP